MANSLAWINSSYASCPADGNPSVENTNEFNNLPLSSSAGTIYFGQRGWSDASDRVICKVRQQVRVVNGNISGKDFYCLIWSMTGNNLNAIVGTSDPVVGDNGWSVTNVFFPFTNKPSLSAGTNYAIVFTMVLHGDPASTPNQDGTNFVTLTIAGTDVLAGGWDTWDAGGSEQSGVQSADMTMGLYYFA